MTAGRLNRHRMLAAVCLCAVIATGLGGWQPAVHADTAPADSGLPAVQVLSQTPFGKVAVQPPGPAPKGVALLLTGSDGPDASLQALADAIAQQNYVIATIDSNAPELQQLASSGVAGDVIAHLLELNATLDERYHLAGKRPVLVGYRSGATLVYRVLAQAGANQFHGGVSLDFCPASPASPAMAPMQPKSHLDTVWFVFQHAPACDADAAARFVQAVDNARLNSAVDTKAASGTTSWQPAISILQWLDPGMVDQLQADESITGVPLIEVLAQQYKPGGRMAVFLSGDGGWAELDRSVTKILAGLGIPVVGWDSLSYFWRAKTPERASQDLDRVLQHYEKAWQPDRISLIGYSFGGNVLPFMASRLPTDWRTRIDQIVLISPEARASFEFHLSNWITSPTENTVPLLPELARLDWTKVLCVYGDTEKAPACPGFAMEGVSVLALKGDHHFDGAYSDLTRRIVPDWPLPLGENAP